VRNGITFVTFGEKRYNYCDDTSGLLRATKYVILEKIPGFRNTDFIPISELPVSRIPILPPVIRKETEREEKKEKGGKKEKKFISRKERKRKREEKRKTRGIKQLAADRK
jgi:hypothetical protein